MKTTITQINSQTKLMQNKKSIVPHRCFGVYMLQVDHNSYPSEQRAICYIGKTRQTLAQRVSEHTSRLFLKGEPEYIKSHIQIGLRNRSKEDVKAGIRMLPLEIFDLNDIKKYGTDHIEVQLLGLERFHYFFQIAKHYVAGEVVEMRYTQNAKIPGTQKNTFYHIVLNETEEYFQNMSYEAILKSSKLKALWNIFSEGEPPESKHERVLTPSIKHQDKSIPEKFLAMRARERDEVQSAKGKGRE